MKRLFLAILLFITTISFSSCYEENSVAETDRRDIYRIITVSVPYVCRGDMTFDTVTYKETDAYGRELFLYRKDLYMSSDTLDIWVICQKTVEEQTYYYQDYCYYVCQVGYDISAAELVRLKERNDWGKPLDETKMASIYCGEEYSENRDFEYYLQFEKGDTIKDDMRSEFDAPTDSYIYLDGIGSDAQGNAIIFVLITEKKNGTLADKAIARYLVRYDKNLQTMINYISVSDSFNLQDQIHGFRSCSAMVSDSSVARGDGSLS